MRTDWPHGADVAVSLTFDVDAESGWLGEDLGLRRPAVTYTMHPEVIGRGYRAKLLDRLITRMSESAGCGSRPTEMWQPSWGDDVSGPPLERAEPA